MISNDPATLLNAVTCGAIAARLFLFRRNGSEYVRWAAFLAYGLILASGSVTIRILMGAYDGTTDPAELFINIVLCIQVLCTGGNVVRMFKIKGKSDV